MDVMPSRMSGSGRKACQMSGVVARLFRMSGSGQETLPEVREWSKNHSGFQGVVGRPSKMTASGRDALPDVREW